MPSTTAPEHRSKEVRICLVMYGGVSLAVYINGSAREFYDLVRGRGIWGVLKALADIDVTVDVVSGASAGGINGLFLSYALCRQKEFSPLARLWREKAGFADLLQDASNGDAASVLNSDYMEAELEKAFWEMDAAPVNPEVAEIGPTVPQELDCFIATTNYDGHYETIGDFRGSTLSLRSHRATIHLKHRAGRKHPFGIEPDGNLRSASTEDPSVDPRKFSLSKKVLAKIARATSAFPVAFEPVELHGEDLKGRFTVRGDYLKDGQSAWFIDGGVLDNKPFTPTLPMIYQRHADRPVDRLLFFVEPDPEIQKEILDTDKGKSENPGKREEPRQAPNFLKISLSALSALPSYESISGDLEALDQHNRCLDLLETVFGFPYKSAPRGNPNRRTAPCPKPPAAQQKVYRKARLYRLIEKVAEELDKETQEKLKGDVVRTAEDGETSAQGQFARFFEAFEKRFVHEDRILPKGQSNASESYNLDDFDIGYVKRAYFYWIYELHAWLERDFDEKRSNPSRPRAAKRKGGPMSDEQVMDLRLRISRLSCRVDMLLIMEARLLAALQALRPQNHDESPKFSHVWEIWRRHVTASDSAFEAIRWEHNELLTKDLSNSTAVETFSREYCKVHGEQLLLPVFLDMLDLELSGLWGLAAKPGEGLCTAVSEFRCIDTWRYPALLLSRLGEMDRIEYYRISPLDSVRDRVKDSVDAIARWDKDPMSKVAGQKLAHFGAFLKRSWRSNDILWGRMDTATILWDVLINKKRLRPNPARVAALEADPEFRKLDPELQRRVREFGQGQDTETFCKNLLHYHQEAIYRDEICTVLADAVNEEISSRQPPYDLSPPRVRWDPAASSGLTAEERYEEAILEIFQNFKADSRDPLLRAVNTQGIMNARPRKLDVEKFFREGYDVGNERIGDMDRIGLAAMGLHSARVLSNMSTRLLPKGKAGDWFRRVIFNRVSIGITTLHLAIRSIRDGWFPLVWVALTINCLAVIFLQGVLNLNLKLPLFIPWALLLALFLLPTIWFGRLAKIRWPFLGLTLVAVFWTGATFFSPDSRKDFRQEAQKDLRKAAAYVQTAVASERGVFPWGTILSSSLSLGAGAVFGGWLQRRRQQKIGKLEQKIRSLIQVERGVSSDATQAQKRKRELLAEVKGLQREKDQLERKVRKQREAAGGDSSGLLFRAREKLRRIGSWFHRR